MDSIKNFLDFLEQFLTAPLFEIGEKTISLWVIIYITVLVFLLFFITGKCKNLIVSKLLLKSKVDIGVRQAVGSIIRYIVIFIGLIIIFDMTGIDLTAFSIIAGAVGLGVGFGMQNIVNHVISGFIILLERPVKIGDRIEVGTVHGEVIKISPRATTVLTNDNISIIIPNSDFISTKVTNWSYTDRNVRFNIPIGVSYRSDPEIVKRCLLEAANLHPGVLKTPAPEVLLSEFGDSSINFILRVWTHEYINRPLVLRSDIYFFVFSKFKESGIEIPYPQRDIHIKTPAELK